MAEEPKERKAFEAHMRVGGYSNHDKHPDGSYVSSAMELWWQGWKARAQLPSQGGEAVAWARQCDLDESDPAIFVAREEVQESGYVVPLYTHPADQLEDDLIMVKVSRELLERALKADASIGANAIQLADGWNAMAELRALLAKP